MRQDVFHASPLQGASQHPRPGASRGELYRECLELRKRVLFLRQVLSSMYTGILVADCEGRIQTVNHAFLTLLGYSEHQLLGRSLASLLVGESAETSDFVDDILAKNEEQVLRTAEGNLVDVVISPTVMFDDEGNITCVVCTVVDMTERKKLEAELRQTQKLEAIGTLAAGIVHEISSPLQFAAHNAEYLATVLDELPALAERGPLDGAAFVEPRDACRGIGEGIERIANMVRALREYAHPATSQRSVADLNQTIERALVICRHEYRRVADVELELAPLPELCFNSGEISRVVLNLVVNAAHAIEDGNRGTRRRGRIRIGTRLEDGFAVIWVTDDGTGIPEAFRGRIFDPFFTTKEVGRGTGQGLAIARSLVEGHGGSIGFETAEGRGTTFHIRLPVAAHASSG